MTAVTDDLALAVLAAIDRGEADRLEMHRCPQRCRLGAVYGIRGTPVWMIFSRRVSTASLTRPDGTITAQCKHGFNDFDFREVNA